MSATTPAPGSGATTFPTVRCADCGVEWNMTGRKRPTCFTDGSHRHEMDGKPVVFHEIGLR